LTATVGVGRSTNRRGSVIVIRLTALCGTQRRGVFSHASIPSITRYPRIILRLIVACSIVALLSAGCAGQRRAVTTQTSPELDDAYRDMRDGKYSQAVSLYLLILQQNEGRPEALQEARFRLGECYYNMRSYLEAGVQFQRYLADYPQGAFAADAKQYLEKLQGIEEQKRQQEELRKQEIRARLEHWREIARREPNNADAALQAGHALWDLQEYEEAGRQYLRAIQLDQNKRYDPLVNERMSFHEDGTATVLTPEDQERLERERNPIQVFNTHAYKGGGRDLFTSGPRYYIVTGQVVNRSNRTINNVAIIVTIFDFGGHVLDSASYRIGTMRPGQIRAFRTSFGTFENIYNIDKYEYEAVFD
jgi:tetratricopeptide (TPR) repeat protein